jgi:cytochrome b subunit of formate dehydrogenase
MAEADPHPTVERMTLLQRIDHALLALCVLLLVVSGLALAYHEHSWAQALIALMGGLGGRHWVHRAAAVGLVGAAFLHLGGLLFSRRYQRDLRDLLFARSDLSEAVKGWRHNWTGKGQPPRYGRFTPMQKFQYWGILAACLLMVLSGLVLWSPQASLAIFPKAFIDLMLVLHSREAQLMFIVLILWHIYDVHVAAGNFPMNPAWLTGRMPADVYRRQHLGEVEAQEREGKTP